MEVDSSPTNTDSTHRSVNIRIDGIDIGTEHLDRNELVEKLKGLVSTNAIVLLTAPAGSGKTSLYNLYKASVGNDEVIGISCLDDRSIFELLSEKGIDLTKKLITGYARKEVVVFLDDAQAKYEDAKFWNQLVKTTGIWLPNNIKFIISATHSLAGGKESPVEFQSLPRLSRTDFLVTDEEAYKFLDFLDIGLPEKMKRFQTLKDVIVKDSGGLVAALRLSVDSLKENFMKDTRPPETSLLQHCFSNNFVQRMARCFGSSHSNPIGDDFKNFLKRCFVNEKIQLNSLENPADVASYSSLKKAGILVELPDTTFAFSSMLAKRYYFKWIFPKRSMFTPKTLPDLIRSVISSMSANILKNSTVAGDFPKEAVFQHLFMEGLALFTKPDCSICPELSKIFPAESNTDISTTVPGEIDFYLNGNLRWGIELLINGDRIGEHIARFAPNRKYFALELKDYALVDFRGNNSGNTTNVSKHPKRISVFFKKGDYKVAQCFFGADSNLTDITLAD
jgi:hypothetical protein